MRCDLCSAVGEADTFYTYVTATSADQLKPIVREQRLTKVADPIQAEWVYSASFYAYLAQRYRDDPEWAVCRDCHAYLQSEGACASGLVRRNYERNKIIHNGGDELLTNLVDAIYQEIVLGLLYFWYWRHVDYVGPIAESRRPRP